MDWFSICNVDDLQKDAGVCALVNHQQIAIFFINQKTYVIDNFDPFGKANVLYRGIVGDVKGQIVVASPLYKQHFNLETGVCLEDESVILPVYLSRIENGIVQIGVKS